METGENQKQVSTASHPPLEISQRARDSHFPTARTTITSTYPNLKTKTKTKTKTKKALDREATEIARALSGEKEMKAKKTARGPAEPMALGRNFLHAAALEFEHPKSGKGVALKSEIPLGLRRFLDRLRTSK